MPKPHARRPVADRFWEKVDRSGPTDCWIWTATIHSGGYGTFYPEKGKPTGAHRIAYEWLVGPIPEGLVIDHLCRVRACVNPAHMEPVTMREKVLRGEGFTARQARQTHCSRGHALSGVNLVRWGGKRRCRTCHNAWQRARKAAA